MGSKKRSFTKGGASKLAVAAMAKVVHFSAKELQSLQARFELAAQGQTQLPRDKFQDALEICGFQQGDKEILDRLFTVFDTTGDGDINFREFVIGISIISKGTLKEKLEFAFKCIDSDQTGSIDKEEMVTALKILNKTAGHFGDREMKVQSIEELVDNIFEETDKDGNGTLCWREYLNVVAKHPYIVSFIMQDDSGNLLKPVNDGDPVEVGVAPADGDAGAKALQSPRDAPNTPSAEEPAKEEEGDAEAAPAPDAAPAKENDDPTTTVPVGEAAPGEGEAADAAAPPAETQDDVSKNQVEEASADAAAESASPESQDGGEAPATSDPVGEAAEASADA